VKNKKTMEDFEMKIFEFKNENGRFKKGEKIADLYGYRGNGPRVYKYGKTNAVAYVLVFDYNTKQERKITADDFGVDYIKFCRGLAMNSDTEWEWLIVPSKAIIEKHMKANQEDFGFSHYPPENWFEKHEATCGGGFIDDREGKY
jgi:hypothetical protein